ncbi:MULTISPECIES: metalloregulator ArsR/SmtB family transcription factor [Fulvivirga]|jgi:ArsR family transcriptional regulator|uniref:ArsR/SmtB family transcription factor n=1 Tax=Fulvivirga TaxID=396811 RepID=UPI0012BCE5AD|nr:metalloregulator ArsR/SmtB family transcription factor [Fulvivirga lutimaris]MTI40063.1 metalloregulator ArsR/SmtB family transcription factor [Fulvivirga lutimaris]
MRLKNFNLAFGSQIFKACSDESRVRILHLIFKNKEMCISDLEHILEFTQTKTSRHLIYLKNSGILSTRKQDQWVFYYLKDEVYEIISQIFQFLNKDQLLVADLNTYKTMYSNRELARNKLESKTWKP